MFPTAAYTLRDDDRDALLQQARALACSAAGAPRLLSGKRLALICADGADASATEFMQAATALGAHVALVQAGLDERSSDEQIDAQARVLGRLYDAVECQHLPPAVVKRLARSAGIPVFAGLATAEHPTAALADQVDGGASWAVKRRSVLQATLLSRVG